MRVGLVLGEVAGTVAEAQRAERLGFDYVAAGEHLFFHGEIGNAFVTLAAAAGATTRVRLVSAITLLPLYAPALAAKLAATLDVASLGRFELGVGIGGEYPPEFAAVGVPVGERARRLEEALEVMRLLFAGGPVTHAGAYGSLEGVTLAPPPLQPGGPPIWMGGRRERSIDRAARLADVWMPYLVTPEMLASGLTQVRAAAEAVGRPSGSVGGAVFAWTCVGEQRRAAAIRRMSATYDQDFAPYADRYLVLGSADEVSERLLAYRDAGAETVLIALAAETGEREQITEEFASEVLPRLAG